jgi:hypothetical protein
MLPALMRESTGCGPSQESAWTVPRWTASRSTEAPRSAQRLGVSMLRPSDVYTVFAIWATTCEAERQHATNKNARVVLR